ncbi:hypothetical protein [Paraburkholderia fungorum]|uniref:hypothetical protein n=1 Tax=Paraburkholderia fungorum TaxID=134537 RepID=UPI003877B9F4
MLNSTVKALLDNKARQHCLKKVHTLNVEYLFAYDLVNGTTVGECMGSANSVPIPSAVASAGADPTRRIKVIHVHPASVSFSTTDIIVMLTSPGFAELEAVGPDGSIFWCKIDALPQHSLVADFFVARSYQAYLRALQRNGFPKSSQAATFLSLEFAHIISSALARLGVLDYQGNVTAKRAADLKVHAPLFAAMLDQTVNQLTDLRW